MKYFLVFKHLRNELKNNEIETAKSRKKIGDFQKSKIFATFATSKKQDLATPLRSQQKIRFRARKDTLIKPYKVKYHQWEIATMFRRFGKTALP